MLISETLYAIVWIGRFNPLGEHGIRLLETSYGTHQFGVIFFRSKESRWFRGRPILAVDKSLSAW